MYKTDIGKQINATGFTLKGFSDNPELQAPLFVLFLVIYLIVIFGNMTIFTAISQDSHLHTPMYIFLMNLSVLDISLTSDILPNLLHVLLTQYKYVSFNWCISQLYIFGSLTCTEVLILGAMAYDRYVAICHPLHYASLMSLKRCSLFSGAAWMIGFLDFIGHPVFISKLFFCSSRLVDHFFCDVTPLLMLSCSDTINVEVLNYIEGTLMGCSSFLLILISYIFIIHTVLTIRSVEGRYKAFSTCTSHLTCVIIFYGSIICLHMRPTSTYYPNIDKLFSLVNIALVPMLNPLIYSLKNKEVKDALRRLISSAKNHL
ncbi:olfactory receptor-like protein COR4 [Discoglossus pictus]